LAAWHPAAQLPQDPFEAVANRLHELSGGIGDDDEQTELAERNALFLKRARGLLERATLAP